MDIKIFTFSPYQENTFVISDANGTCAIIDPGCYTTEEKATLDAYIAEKSLNVTTLLNTHGHIDHMFGNKHIKEKYDVSFVTHKLVIPELEAVQTYASMMGLNPDPSPMPDQLVEEGNEIIMGDIRLEVIFTPGHSAGHISFFHREENKVFSGDVLFQGSIGRTDLPGGSYPTLMETITKKILPLGDDVEVYCGHGPMTIIGRERISNPFILEYLSKNQS